MPSNTARSRQSKYGITPERFDTMLRFQNYRCAICRDQIYETRRQCLDHDHTTGKPRGILCPACNTGIGQLKDNILIVEAAGRYLQRHHPDHVARAADYDWESAA